MRRMVNMEESFTWKEVIYIKQQKTIDCNVALAVDIYHSLNGWFKYDGLMCKNRGHQKYILEDYSKSVCGEEVTIW